MHFTEKNLLRLSELAKLSFSDAELQKMHSSLETIVSYLDQLSTISVDDINVDSALSIRTFNAQDDFWDPSLILDNALNRKWNFVSVKTSLDA